MEMNSGFELNAELETVSSVKCVKTENVLYSSIFNILMVSLDSTALYCPVYLFSSTSVPLF